MADLLQPEACVPGWSPECLAPHVEGDLDRVYSFAIGLVTATIGVLTHAGLDVPDLRTIDVYPVGVPEAAKGGCGCQGITVGIGNMTRATTYDNCLPKEIHTRFEVRIYQCRATVDEVNPRGVIGDLDGAMVNSINGATLESTRVYMAIRRHLVQAIRGLGQTEEEEDCRIAIGCDQIRDVTYALNKAGRCNYVAARFDAKI